MLGDSRNKGKAGTHLDRCVCCTFLISKTPILAVRLSTNAAILNLLRASSSERRWRSTLGQKELVAAQDLVRDQHLPSSR